MSSENWKLEKDLCRCCHSEGSFKNLAEPFKITELAEIYADMLKECYDIDMAPVPGMLSAATYTICEVCVIRLRDASDFKKQVLSCEERFKDMYNRNVIKAALAVTSVEVVVKQETLDSEPDDEFKEELSQDDNDDEDYDESMDLKISEEDDKPLQVEVRKKRKYKTRATVKNATVKTKRTKRKTLKQESADTENDAERKQGQSAVVTPNSYLKEHYTKVGDTYHCTRCDKTYRRASSLSKHVRKDHLHIPRYKCSICGEVFMTLPPFTVHKLKAHNIDDRVKCSQCNKMFNTKRQLKVHINVLHKHGEVGERHVSNDRFKIPRYKCSICNETFSTLAPFTVHKLDVHNVDDRVKCSQCNKMFNTKRQLKVHINVLHKQGKVGERHVSNDQFKIPRYKCSICIETFSTLAPLIVHKLDVHNVDDRVKCSQCNNMFNTKRQLKVHINVLHKHGEVGEKPVSNDQFKIPRYRCSICIETFSTLAPLTVHKLDVHNVDDRVQCSSCNKKFNTKMQLRVHLKYFHILAEVGERHKCEFCDFQTFKSYALRRHKIVHKNVKDFHCRFCKKSFKRKTTLDLHERIHTGDRRKVCTVCGQAFVQKAALNYHMKKYHP